MSYMHQGWNVIVDGGFRQYEMTVLPGDPSQIVLCADHAGDLTLVSIESGSGANVSSVFIGNLIQCAYNTKPRRVRKGENITILLEDVTNPVKVMVVMVAR